MHEMNKSKLNLQGEDICPSGSLDRRKGRLRFQSVARAARRTAVCGGCKSKCDSLYDAHLGSSFLPSLLSLPPPSCALIGLLIASRYAPHWMDIS